MQPENPMLTLEQVAATLKPGEYVKLHTLHGLDKMGKKKKEDVTFQLISDIAATCTAEGKEGADYLGFRYQSDEATGDDNFLLIFKK